ncbi:hypothetical protein EYF80_025676 [Liparis tanakae]|uniref:Uncharacterized protein n=1 Tax=Liparis tanakae TaxID=230148 RepID=A0A4Z2HE71_9TELE|nr:hypothetical protein EYF80_025676 [Liparis tanakae]
MARGTSGLGVRSRFLMGCRVIGGAVRPPALGLPWNAMSFMWASVVVHHDHDLLIRDAVLVNDLVGMASISLGGRRINVERVSKEGI